MPFQIIKGNLSSLPCDAVVNPSDELLSGSGGLDAQIHAAAGPELALACEALVPLAAGEAVLTPAYRLPCLQIIHTVAPWWTGENEELELLRACYRSALQLVRAHGLSRVAFPLIGSGTRGFPKELVLRIAAEELMRGLSEAEDCELLLVIHDRSEFQPDPAILAGFESYRRLWHSAPEDTGSFPAMSAPSMAEGSDDSYICSRPPREDREYAAKEALPAASLFRPDRKIELDESFSQMVLRKIEERGFRKDSECYTRANVDRRVFSRLRCDPNYHPKKTTALALAVALELSLPETRELLEKAGYSLSRSLLFDVIVEYCIREEIYDIFAVNELLFEYDQPLLGG